MNSPGNQRGDYSPGTYKIRREGKVVGGDWAVMGGGGDHRVLIPMFSPFFGPSSILSSFSILSNLLRRLGNT